ncbi:unnamed protein product [Lactuca saligna]|uniref:histone acetyltransferase n=1 Tax=Lactuca saligna TaxID=75948 RepID=A0AA35YWS5_LACSI|nr:unnamed protein product [Lactuca saligna]
MIGFPSRVFMKKFPTCTPDLQIVAEGDDAHVIYAKKLNFCTCLNLTVFEIDGETCLGVVEVVTTSQKVNLRDELENICKALEVVDLRSSEFLVYPKQKDFSEPYDVVHHTTCQFYGHLRYYTTYVLTLWVETYFLLRCKDLTLILMSATLNPELFSNYFQEAPMIHIPEVFHEEEEPEIDDTNTPIVSGESISLSAEPSTGNKSGKPKIKGVSMIELWWVQCDRCEAWQHQICALFNGRRNDGGQVDYTCPNCYMEEVERGESMPRPQSVVLGAKDLPRTILSDHIESRLFGKLKQERLERARLYGETYNEVPGVEALVVRVVSSMDKKLEVKQRFLEIFQEENYPVELRAECPQPNHRRVYLSYLDSVKYFRPKMKAMIGEALHTFAYHEIKAVTGEALHTSLVEHSDTSMSFKIMDDGQVFLYAVLTALATSFHALKPLKVPASGYSFR